VKLVTFGEPRTGNLAYAKAVEANVPFRYRVVNRNDALSNVPASVDPDNLLLTVASAERQPYFYRFAVHYKQGMESREADFELCEYPEDHNCRPLGLAADVNDHMNYFGGECEMNKLIFFEYFVVENSAFLGGFFFLAFEIFNFIGFFLFFLNFLDCF
jgi:hypothetical protein